MIRDELAKLKTSPRDLRKFGLVVGGVFVLLALVLWRRHLAAWPWLMAPGAGLVGLGLLWPHGLRWIYLVWMALALVLGHVVSTVLLTGLFYLVLTPLGLFARVRGKDFLHRKWDRAARSYWLPRDSTHQRSPEDYELQF
jgi:hypothetical protein